MVIMDMLFGVRGVGEQLVVAAVYVVIAVHRGVMALLQALC